MVPFWIRLIIISAIESIAFLGACLCIECIFFFCLLMKFQHFIQSKKKQNSSNAFFWSVLKFNIMKKIPFGLWNEFGHFFHGTHANLVCSAHDSFIEVLSTIFWAYLVVIRLAFFYTYTNACIHNLGHSRNLTDNDNKYQFLWQL